MKPQLLMALHFHQPVGNFDSVFEEAVRTCYRPVLEHFDRHPTVPAAFHFSGCLLEWLETHDRKLLDHLFQMVGRGQIEPMGGGFYEPILTVIPREDGLEQIARLSEYWKKRTGVLPKGAWLTERVWEPSLAELLYDAGIGYTILDDHHIRLAGFLDSRFSGLFSTERNGKGLAFFPSDFQLRYLIPFRTVETIRDHFLAMANESVAPVYTYGDDAEKFGMWPGTHKWVYEEQWLEKFLCLIEDPSGPVEVKTPGSYFSQKPPTRKVYIPNASYTEMLEWSLPATSVKGYSKLREAAKNIAGREEVDAFVRGSLWDMFLWRYPEANQMHKHMLWSSRGARGLPANSKVKEAAITAALRSQCNCAYWHGLFGGVYLPHLRHGIYSSILESDALRAQEDVSRPRAEKIDLDGDLQDEIILLGKTVQAFFRPEDGGTLAELDYLPSRFNVTNIVSRWRESYHDGTDLTHGHHADGAIASPHERSVNINARDLESVSFDSRPLRSLRDFVSKNPVTPAALSRFVGMTLSFAPVHDVELLRSGWASSQTLSGIGIRKQIELTSSDDLIVTYEFLGAENQTGWFGTTLALSLLTPEASDRKMILATDRGEEKSFSPGSTTTTEVAHRITLEDRAFGFSLTISAEPVVQICTSPIETLQRSEDGYQKAYQGTLISLSWPLPLRSAALKVSFRNV